MLLLLFLSGQSIADSNQAITVQITPSKDNTLYESSTGSLSNGAGAHFFAGRTGLGTGGVRRRGVIAFNISSKIPPGSMIQSVTLTLSMSRSISVAQNISLHKLAADWGEGASNAAFNEGGGAPSTTNDATWLHRFFNTSTWTTPGGDFSSAASATQLIGGLGSYIFGSTAQIVADVQGWLDNPGNNFGWILIGNEASSQTAKRFDTKENSLEANWPSLTVTYLPPPCCVGLRGDYNGDTNNADILDLNYLVDNIFRGGPAAPCTDEADIDNDGQAATVVDLNFLVDLIFRGGPNPAACP